MSDRKNLIMGSEDYKKLNIKSPYYYNISANNQSLYYFGDNHSHDPSDVQYPKLLNFWKDFLVTTEGKTRLVFIEGGLRDLQSSTDKAIQKDSTPGLMSFLANQANIKISSPDPDDQKLRIELEKDFTLDEIQYYYFARMVAQWQRKNVKDESFEDYISRSLDYDKQNSTREDYEFSLDHMYKIHTKLFGQEIDLADKQFFHNIGNPHLESRVNLVSRNITLLRDEYIVTEILKSWTDNFNIFCVFGFGHAVVQETALRKLII